MGSSALDWPAYHQVQSFLHAEARMLDEERYEEWLDLFTADAHYWVPSLENRWRRDPVGSHQPGRMAHFDDDLDSLRLRVARFRSPHAWAEDPATRQLHLVANIEAEVADAPGEVLVRSAFVTIRGRGLRDEDVLGGRRVDVLRTSGQPSAPEPLGRLHIASRKVTITQSMILAKNMNLFL